MRNPRLFLPLLFSAAISFLTLAIFAFSSA